MNRKCLCFISGLGAVGMLMTASVNASDGGSKIDYSREWNPYVTLRGGWLFGTAEFEEWLKAPGGARSDWQIRNIKNAWSGSMEFGKSYDDRVFVGLELGYFTGKAKDFSALGWKVNGKVESCFGACNVTLRHDVGECAFLYGGVGAGIVQSKLSAGADTTVTIPVEPPVVVDFSSKESEGKWGFLGQAFAGIGVYLNENWQFMAGYRLRYVSGSFCASFKSDAIALEYGNSVKQDIIHAAEVGLTYSF